MQSLKPEQPTKLEYFQLSREFNKKGLIYRRYRNLMRYWEQYEEIAYLGKFVETLIKDKGT